MYSCRRPSIALGFLLVLATAAPHAVADEDGDGGKDPSLSVVKISAMRRDPDVFHPWMKEDAEAMSGTGVVIEGRRILTNAHVVTHSSQIFIHPARSGDKIAATVRAIAPGIDLAVLTVDDDDDDAFFEKHPPLPRAAKLPSIRDTVHVLGFPRGGESISFTRGVVSRIEFTDYYYEMKGLRIQVDAAINPGNSGGPAVVDDRMVGIIFSRLQESDNIGYIIPNEEIDLFLADVADGTYDGKPILFDILQRSQNEAMRERLKLGPEATGMLVREPDSDEPEYPLRRRDLIHKIGDHPIDDSGMSEDDRGLRLDFTYYVQKLTRGGTLPLEVIRDGKELHLDLPVTPYTRRPRLLPYLENGYPSYLVWGPLVFSSATNDFMESFTSTFTAEKWFPFFLYDRSPLIERAYDRQRFEGEQLVVAVAMFPHQLTDGYRDLNYPVVDAVNGVKVRNLRHLADLLRETREEFITVRFQNRYAEDLVFNREEVLEAEEEILSDNGVRATRSIDLRGAREPGH